jgi:ribonucleoside-diphosphate reductase alpha chain/ribonucleoside-triphosphate reductase
LVRRTAEIAIIDPHDEECVHAKDNIQPGMEHRYMSNNSIYQEEKPSREKIHELFNSIRTSGEPGIINVAEAKRRRSDFAGVNPCAEILLPPNAVCNLTTVNMVAFVNENGDVDWDGLELAFLLSARAGYRMTCVDLELDGWNEAHHRDRLTGCSMTGWQDFVAKVRPDVLRRAGGKAGVLKWLRTAVHEAGEEIAQELQTPVPLLMTALKPEGSLSLVANGVSPGVHWQHSPYFIRRIRVNAHDPLALTAKELGWQIHPEVGQEMETATTIVIDFPIKSPATVTKADVSAVEQLEEYLLFQKHYTDMNTSNTITVKPDEWEEVEDFVYNHWDDMLGVTFLELNSTYYPLLPYEECTKEEYEELKSKMKEFDPDLLNEKELSTRNMGKEFEILDDRESCASGVCPIR